MQRLALAVSILALGLAAVSFQRSLARSASAREVAGELERFAEKLEAHAAAAHAAPEAAKGIDVTSLESRVAELERLSARGPVEATPVEAAAPIEPASGEHAAVAGQDATARAELAELLKRLIGSDYDLHGSKEEIQRFFELARDGGLLADILKELESRVASNPNDVEARMDLADGYVAKIMTMPHGPEQGVWGEKAEEQWRAVTERDPEHWGAHFALGTNFSFYPDVMGKTGEAIRCLESARKIQAHLPPAAEHVQTYLSLARLYLRENRRDEAIAVLQSGLQLHPGNAGLLAELQRVQAG
jgi:tetratricopeptide (TPR) repeat protein